MKELLKQARECLAEGRLSEARKHLEDLGRNPGGCFQAGAPLASAESYRIPPAYRQLFDDRIQRVNDCIAFGADEFESLRSQKQP